MHSGSVCRKFGEVGLAVSVIFSQAHTNPERDMLFAILYSPTRG